MSIEKAQDWLESFHKVTPITQIPSSSESRAKTISITGGKGGVGKTSVALKIAAELSKQNKKVLLVDYDYNLSNTCIKLGAPLNNYFYDLLTSSRSFDDCLYKMPNFHLLSGCNGNLDLFDESIEVDKILIDIINTHSSKYDYVLIDCPAGLTKDALTLNAYCDYRFVVVTPDKSSLTDSYSLVKVLKTKYGINENHLIINKVSDEKEYKRIVRTLSETIESFLECRSIILGSIRHADQLGDNFDQILLRDENSSLHKDFCKIVRCFTEKSGGPTVNQYKMMC